MYFSAYANPLFSTSDLRQIDDVTLPYLGLEISMKHLYSISRGEKGFRGKKGKLVKQWALNQANTSESGRFKGREKNAFWELRLNGFS